MKPLYTTKRIITSHHLSKFSLAAVAKLGVVFLQPWRFIFLALGCGCSSENVGVQLLKHNDDSDVANIDKILFVCGALTNLAKKIV